MRIVDVRETTVPLASPIKNAFISFFKMICSLKAKEQRACLILACALLACPAFATVSLAAASTEEMAWIPAGEFTMGTDDPRSFPNERPVHRVKVDGFWMDKHDVTNDGFNK